MISTFNYLTSTNLNNMNKNKPLRIIIGILSIAFIVYMWIKKDILSVFNPFTSKDILPYLVTTTLVTIGKILLIVLCILLIKWALSKLKNNAK